MTWMPFRVALPAPSFLRTPQPDARVDERCLVREGNIGLAASYLMRCIAAC